MSSESLHEPRDSLSEETIEKHRAIVSLIEELEAVDWYQQRAEACSDPALRDILLHHRNEEVEHAIMNLEWLRRRDATFDEMCRTYLFTNVPVTEVEEAAEGAADAGPASGTRSSGGSLRIGSLKQSTLAHAAQKEEGV